VVLDHGAPELVAAAEHGRVAVHEAAKAARLPSNAQTDFLAAAARGLSFAAFQTNYGRNERAAALAETTSAMPVGAKRWPVILVDAPWDFAVYAPDRQTSHPSLH